MKKTASYLGILFILCFLLTGFSYAEENGINPQNQTLSKKELKKQKKLQKQFNKKKKDKDINIEDMKGYYGELPDISGDFSYKQQTSNTVKNTAKIPDDEDLESSNLKHAPTEDALFLDMIVKKEKSSNYLNDIQRTKFALTSLKKCIEENGNIQRFNGCVNMIDLYTKNLKTKYENKSESLKESYIDILSTNYHAKVLGNLMYNANYYSQYVPTTTGEYSKQNIDSEKEKLLNRINKTLFLINQEN